MKHTIEIEFFKRERILILHTDDDSFNDTNIFTSRKTIDIPTNIVGKGTEIYENGGGSYDSWEDVFKSYDRISSQDIKSITIDGKSINENYIKLAKAYGYEMMFPLLYHFQITKEDSENVVNWYPTTGSTTIQNKTQRFSIKKLGTFMDIEDLLIYMQKNEL